MSAGAMLAEALALTRAMLAAAREGAWHEVARLDAERSRHLGATIRAPADGDTLRDMLALNEEITRCALVSRDAAADAWTRRLRALRGANAYLDIARG